MPARTERLTIVPRSSNVLLQDAVRESHRQAVMVSNRDMVLHLQTLFGPDILAFMVGIEDEMVIGRWGRGNLPVAGEREQRLRTVLLIVRLLAVAYSEEVVRGWFFGRNPHLADQTPAHCLGETPDQALLVLAAAKAFVAGD